MTLDPGGEVALQCGDDVVHRAAAIVDRRMLIERARKCGARLRDRTMPSASQPRAWRQPPHVHPTVMHCDRCTLAFNVGMVLTALATSSLVFALAPAAALAQSNQSPSVVLPTVIVTAQKDATDVKEVPASVTAVTADTIADSGLRSSPSGDLRAEHGVHRVHRAQGQQRALPRHRFEPGEPGDHHLPRRRAAAEQQLVEHRAARRQPDRIRARAAEPAVRPQHARRHRQRHVDAAVDVEAGPVR